MTPEKIQELVNAALVLIGAYQEWEKAERARRAEERAALQAVLAPPVRSRPLVMEWAEQEFRHEVTTDLVGGGGSKPSDGLRTIPPPWTKSDGEAGWCPWTPCAVELDGDKITIVWESVRHKDCPSRQQPTPAPYVPTPGGPKL